MSLHQPTVQFGQRLNYFHLISKKNLVALFSLFLFIAPQLCFSQQSLTEEKRVFLQIDYANKVHDTVWVVMGNAEGLGINIDDEIKGMQSYKLEVAGVSAERRMTEVGAGKIDLADTVLAGVHYMRGFIKLYKAVDSLEIGDMVTVNVAVPKKASENIFAQLAFQNIIFYSRDSLPFYRVQNFVNPKNILSEDSIYKKILTDMPRAVQWLKTQSLPKRWTDKIAEGRLKGQYSLDVMEHIGRADIRSFLLYATDYSSGYRGKNLLMSIALESWVVVGGTHGPTEIKTTLLPLYKNKILFDKQLQLYKHDIVSESSIEKMIGETQDLSDEYKDKEAEELGELTLAIAYALDDSINLPFAHLALAYVFQNETQYAKAIQQCDKSVVASRRIKESDYEIQALMKKAYCSIKLSRFSDAESAIELGTKTNYEYRGKISEEQFQRNAIRIFEEEYFYNYKLGDYKKAFQSIDSVIAYENMVNTRESALSIASYLKSKGEVYNAQGQPTDALVVLRNALDLYIQNNDEGSQAGVENEMVSSYFKLGEYDSCIIYARSAAKTFLWKRNYSNAAFSYSWIGQSQWNLGNYDSAILAHDTAIHYGRLAQDTFRLAWSWQKVGELYKKSGEKNIALAKFDTAAYYYSAIKDSSGLAEVYNQKGNVFLNDENYKTTIQFFEKAKSMSKTDIEGFYNLGRAWRPVDTAKSRKYFEDCRKQSIQDSNTYYHFQSSYSLARLAYYEKNFVLGQKYYNECQQTSLQTKKPDDAAYCILLKAYEFEMRIMLDSAINYYKQAADMLTTADKYEKVYCLDDMANVFVSTGEFSKADSLYKEAIALANDNFDQIALGYSLSNSVFLYGRTGDFEKGLKNSDSAFSIFKNSGNHLRLADAYFNRASLLGSSGEFKNSIQSYLTADSIYKAELINSMRSVIYNNIGVVYRNQEDWEKALKNFDQALSLLPKGVVDESYLLSQGNKAECLHYLKRSKEAETLLLQTLPVASKLKLNRIASGMAETLGVIYFDGNKLNEATQYFSDELTYALASGEREKSITALTYLSRINVKSGNVAEAEKNLQQAIPIIEEIKAPSGWEAYYERGLICYNKNKYDSSLIFFKKAVDFLDKSMENLFGGENAKKIFNNDPRKADLYNKIIFAFNNTGNVEDAFQYAMRYNQAGLIQLSGPASLNSSDEAKKDVIQKLYARQKEIEAKKAIAEKQQGADKEETLKQVTYLESQYQDFIETLSNTKKYNDLNQYFLSIQAPNLKTFKKFIPTDLAVLFYIQNNNTLMIITLTHDALGIDTISINPEMQVTSFTESIRSGMLAQRGGTIEDNIKSIQNQADKLYRILFTTIPDSIRSKKRFCIIPTGIYSNMPFQCLGHYSSPNEFHYMIEDHSFSYVSDISIFKSSLEGGVKNDFEKFAAFGVPDSKLRYNLKEVEDIGKIVGSDSTVYTDERATKNKAIESLLRKKIIHFATHGVLNYTSDFSQSYLKLLPDKDNDGRLTIKEINKMTDVDCNMVILSACETAVSKTLTAGWNISPANSLLRSNVRTVVASLWKVDDEPTGMLMEYFYNNLKSMETDDKAEALRLAQIQLLKNPKFAHPNYWGAFALYGDWR